MMLYEYKHQVLIVDSGLMFPENDMLGIDYIIPDLEILKQKQVVAIIITHGHEDHIGAIHHLLEIVQAPIYATQLTRGLLEVKLARYGCLKGADIRTVKAGDKLNIDPFQIEFIHMSHSIPDCVGLAIETPAGLVVHSGDFKFDHTPVDGWPSDFARLASLSQRGVMVLLTDSTNAEEPGWTPSEREVDKAFDQVLRQAKGRVIIASFASLISRIQQAVNAAVRHGRKIAFTGSSMVDNAKMARSLGYLTIPDGLLVPLEQALNMKAAEVLIMCTGAQGEPTSILGRLSRGSYRGFDIRPGDTVVLSSQVIPGNEENVYRTINSLFQQGADVIYEKIAPVHVSGHASQEEIKLLLNLVQPAYYIPIHGELRHLKQNGALARQVGIPPENIAVIENGQVVEFENGKMRLAEKVPAGYVFVDGGGVGDVGPDIMREREVMSREGIVLVHLVIEPLKIRLAAEPFITSYGFMAADDLQEVVVKIRQKISEIVTLSRQSEDLTKEIEQAVRTVIFSETRRRPRVFVSVSYIQP